MYLFIMRFLKQLFKKEKVPTRLYRVPVGELVYAIGDVHGRYDLLEQLIDMMSTDRLTYSNISKCHVIFLGDYVDRGFQSKEVIERLASIDLDWADVVCLQGNHEAMMFDFIDNPSDNEGWLHFGGLATLASYGVRVRENEIGDRDLVRAASEFDDALPDSHKSFIKSLPFHHRIGDYLFVHAGLRPEVELHEQDTADMLFIRHEFTESDYDFGVKVVHGHTGVQNPTLKHNRIAVDTTAYATGRLTAAVLVDDKVDFLTT